MVEQTIKQQFATRENFLKLERLEKQLDELREEADAVEACGIDCQTFRVLGDVFAAQLQNYREKFFNPPPEI